MLKLATLLNSQDSLAPGPAVGDLALARVQLLGPEADDRRRHLKKGDEGGENGREKLRSALSIQH